MIVLRALHTSHAIINLNSSTVMDCDLYSALINASESREIDVLDRSFPHLTPLVLYEAIYIYIYERYSYFINMHITCTWKWVSMAAKKSANGRGS